MYKKLSILILLLAAVLGATAAQPESAASLMAKCAAKVNSAPSWHIRFTFNTGGQTLHCAMTLARQRFAIDAGVARIWYDGSTQWSYVNESKQLTVTEPTAAELLDANPFVILTGYDKVYNVRLLDKIGGLQQVELVAKSASNPVSKAVISIDLADNLPKKVTVSMQSGQTATMTITEIKRGSNPKATTFRYDEKVYPASEIIDLR